MTTVMVLNGPNLSRLGTREPAIYGRETLAEISLACESLGKELGLDVECRQTNHEGELIGWLHEAVDREAHVVLNPAAFTHYSYAVRDACAMVTGAGLTLVEVHLTNPAAREEFRRTSVVSAVVTGTVSGLGSTGYLLALRAVSAKVAAA